MAARAHRGPRETRIQNVLSHDYAAISMRGVNRTPPDLSDLALHPNPYGDLFVDSTWIMQQAVLGEIVTVPKVLFVKHYHDRNTHSEWPRQKNDVIARAWLTHCVDLAAIGLKNCVTQQGRDDIIAAATRRCLNPGCVGVPPWIIDACAKIWRDEASLAVEAGFRDRVAERLADLERQRPDHHGREASNDRQDQDGATKMTRLPLSLPIGAALTALFLVIALISLVWTPHDVENLIIADRLRPAGAEYWLGTDQFGRDMVSMLMVGARISIAVALVAVGIGVALGVPLGLAAAANRGSLLDEVIMRGNDLIFAFPSLVIAILITAVFGPSAFNAILAIGIFNIPVFARVARGGALSLWTLDYVLAARVAGKGRARISLEHILPNISSLLIVQATIQFSLGILAEAALSYIGLSVQPPVPSWGRMLADAQTMIYTHPMLAVLPGLAIVAMVLGLNLMGDGLRDMLDPRLRRLRA